jgi:Ca-activated chloride channel family protein
LSVLLELSTPEAPTTTERAAGALQVVLDRSGSMAGGRLEGAKRALLAVIDRLDPRDCFGLVVFDDRARIAVSAGPLTDKAAVKRAIASVEPGGSTDLAAGYLLGLSEARRIATPGRTTVLLVSDGHANAGETSPDVLGSLAAKAQSADGVTTSTLGFGLGYDERLLSAMSRGGTGSEHFAEDADAASGMIASEVDGLLSQAAQAVTLLVSPSPAVRAVTIHNDLPVHPVSDGLQVELGAMYAGENRRLVLTLDVPGIAELGLLEVASLRLTYVELPELNQVEVTLPLHVNVVPGDHAAGRIRDPEVRAEVAYQQVQAAKRDASHRFSAGDVAGADEALQSAELLLTDALVSAPVGMAASFLDEVDLVQQLRDDARSGAISRAAKVSSADASRKSRRRTE